MGIIVAVVAVVALREPNGHVGDNVAQKSASSVSKQTDSTPSSRPSKATTPSHHRTTSSSSAPGSQATGAVKDVPLIVLNNTMVQGLAAEAAQRFESGGWKVTRFDNYQNDILSTCAYYDPDVPGAEAAAQALQNQYPAIKRVEPRFAELPDGPVVVVLTPDYSSA